ncbi:MAG: MBL fold metallo-hydrolase [Candidatus Methanoperedens sp.]|nr:MBL fold metallo-hydrolase [Candidatus Methanoperedens sp.]
MDKPHQVTPDIDVLPAHFPIPGMGFLQINAFVIKAAEPVLVDTGMGMDSEEFMKALESIINPQDLRWVWLTHDDADHTGSIRKVLEAAPEARLAANPLAVVRMSTAWPVPMDRVYWLNPGESISVGDRKLTAVRPPLFDNPTTIGIYDNKSEVFFSVDSFGAILPSLGAQDADKVKEADLARGMVTWALADNPWVHWFDPDKFSQKLDKIRQMAPKMILSTHLPPARNKTEQFLKLLADVPTLEPFVAPNQAALEQMLAQMKGGG